MSFTPRQALNFIAGANVTIEAADDAANNSIDITISGGPKLWPVTSNPNGTYVEMAPHNMVGASSPTPYVASASTTYGDNYPWQAFNGSTANWSCASLNASTGWLAIDLGSGQSNVATQYAICAYNSGGSPGANCAPNSWQFQGSDDGSNWTTLDTQSGQSGWASLETRTFTFSCSTAYRHYRLNVTANNGGGQMTVLEFYIKYASSPFGSGSDGDYAIDTTNRILYGPLASGSWPRIGSLSA